MRVFEFDHEYWTETAGNLMSRRNVINSPKITNNADGDYKIIVDPAQRKQDWLGVGAAITDSAASLIWRSQDAKQRHRLLTELFSPDQAGFNFIRLPLGSCDFSSQKYYTYDDLPFGEQDYKLENFSIGTGKPGASQATKDLKNIIPVVQEILTINPAVKIIASPWSAPAWMKNTGHLTFGGHLRFGEFTGNGYDSSVDSFEAVYANYFVKYIEAYAQYGIPIYGITVQNEPSNAAHWPAMIWTLREQASFVSQYLRRALDASYPETKIYINDDSLHVLDRPIDSSVSNEQAMKIDGLAIHTYQVPHENLFNGVRSYSHWQLGMTERRCMMNETVEDASRIMFGTIGNWLVRNGLNFATLWNLALDERGLPNAADSTGRRGVVTIDHHTGKVQRNLEYFMLRNFGQDVSLGATVIQSSDYTENGIEGGIGSVAFLGINGDITIQLYNPNAHARTASIGLAGNGNCWQTVTVPAWGTVTCHKSNRDINVSNVPADDSFKLNPTPANNFE
ncbi:O-glycosyl hydrolase [Secundilactobacillus kimchicus JCM 15530]|uniref:O-glycosyl hydrolase n=1 Tax=Secundilactobacillus kimchicus JCM 15530 TaxID=1302272 RepID=A0A0R1HNT0_9LACO|nr:glycosyl hydrolase family 30 [Secundilactobacillus kimchicus]KRK48304.1 O-glycosyl hydrolase [Secundilactobacillus kimchicus JCM 15530]